MERGLVLPLSMETIMSASNETLKYNHMFVHHANITLVKDVIEVGPVC